jgi:geranylgeranyl pyrophosphate synthase
VLTQLREEFIDIFDVSEFNQRVRSEYLPLPIICAIQDQKLARKIRKVTIKNFVTSEEVEKLVSMIFKSKKVMELRNTMKSYVTECIHLVSIIKSEKIRSLLSLLASSMLEDLE